MYLNRPLRITEHHWPKGTSPIVSILCLTYNHDRYIEQCLQGFLKQETTFPVEIIVVDDASDDRTADIVGRYSSNYPTLFRPFFHETNKYSQGEMLDLLALQHSRGLYIATCDGDDYWSLPSKLERQIAVYQENPNCILCGGRVYTVREGDSFPYRIEPSVEPDKLSATGPLEMLKGQFTMRMPSRVTKRSVWENYANKVKGSAAVCDWLFTLYCISESRMIPDAFGCLNEIVGTYREHPGGVWSSADEETKRKSDLAVLTFAIKEFDFAYGREILETGFINLANNMGLTADMDAAAYDLYQCLLIKYQPNSILRRIRNLLINNWLLGAASKS